MRRTEVVREAEGGAGGSGYIPPVRRIRALWAVDAALALALTGWALAEPGVFNDAPRGVVLVAMTVAIAWYRRGPVTVLAVEVAGVVAVPARLDVPQGVAVLIAAYAAAFYSDRRLVVAGLVAVAAAWLWAFGGQAKIPRGLVPVLLVAPVWLAGSAMRRREQRVDQLESERDAALLDSGLDGPWHEAREREAEAGRGLAGMRERTAMYGGTLEARSEPERGFVVRARIPLERASV